MSDKKHNKKIIDDLIRSFIEKELQTNLNNEDKDLIEKYLNNDLSVEQNQVIEQRMSSDEEFSFLIDLIKFETKRKKPKSYLSYLALKMKLYFRELKIDAKVNDFTQENYNMGPYPTIAAKSVSSSLTPAISMGFLVLFLIQFQPIGYKFDQSGYNRNIYNIDPRYRGTGDSLYVAEDSLTLSFESDSLLVTWSKNKIIKGSVIYIDQHGYLVYGNELKVYFPMEKRFLVKLYNKLLKEDQKDIVWSRNDILDIIKIEYVSIRKDKYAENFKFNKNEIDKNLFGTPIIEKKFRFNIN